MDVIPDLELGLAEELMVGLGGEQIGQGAEVGFGGLTERLIDPIGECGLFGSQRLSGNAEFS